MRFQFQKRGMLPRFLRFLTDRFAAGAHEPARPVSLPVMDACRCRLELPEAERETDARGRDELCS